MLDFLHSRTRFERNLFFGILLIAVVLGATSVISLIIAQRRFEDLLESLWSRSRGEDLQSDLAFFANKQLNDLALDGADLLSQAASACPPASLDARLDCIADWLQLKPALNADLTPRCVQAYMESPGGWELVHDRSLVAAGTVGETEGGRDEDVCPRHADLSEFTVNGTQPKQRHVGFIQSFLEYREGPGDAGEHVVLVLVSTTGSGITTRWRSSVANVERPSFTPIFSQLIWLQITGLLIALAVIGAVAIVVSRILSARLSEPLADLVGAMERVGSGDLDFRARPSKQQEFGYLIESFNTMADGIRRLNEETRQAARMKHELEMGREIQLGLLPHRLPRLPGYDLYACNVPSLELSGDYYDVISWGDGGDLVLAVADVSGKGLPAAMLMSNAQAWLHSQALRPRVELTECMAILNHLLVNSTDAGTFLTSFIGILSPEERKLVYVNGGHPPALLLRDGGECLELHVGGPVVGVIPDAAYDSEVIDLRVGDTLCLYTDGITEAVSPSGEEFGSKGLSDLLLTTRALSARDILSRIIEAVQEHSHLERQSDDVTMLVLKVLARG
jgi:serine phosphatase RsbU (regulator of sigma subunit)